MASFVERVEQQQQRVTYSVLIRGRERVRHVLVPHLGEAHALERANNIAQALLFGDIEPTGVAEEMLRALPGDLRRFVAERVCEAWSMHEEESEALAHE